MFADNAWFDTYLARLEQVTKEQVLACARSYLLPAKRVVGFYRPGGEGAHG
jgi:predicted Zn-dependent peptidase